MAIPSARRRDLPELPKLRLWPGVVLGVLLILVRFVVPLIDPEAEAYGVMGGVLGGLAIALWWVFFSRAPWSERLGAIGVIIGGVFATSRLVDPSISNGMMGMMLPVFAIQVLSLVLVAWAVFSQPLTGGPRRASMVAAILLSCGMFALVRTGGISGGGGSDLHWRWTETPEERLLAQTEDKRPELPKAPTSAKPVEPGPAAPAAQTKAASSSAPSTATLPAGQLGAPAGNDATAPPIGQVSTETGAEWPGFRGPNRDGVVRGVQIKTDWAASPPVELWRRAIGPGWSSFAVHGDLIYTQEQRGDDEVVSCYRLTTGEPVWKHRDAARFWESNGGAGPRATPFFSNGRVYTLGATGLVNALDAASGAVIWSRNVATDTGAENPGWGFAGSPLVIGDLVVVAASGRLAGYEVATGHPRWFGPKNGGGYSSPHLATIDGVAQILLARGSRTTSFAPTDGALLWEDSWQPGVSIVQPALAENGDILIAPGDAMGGTGIRRLAVAHDPAGWSVQERWTSRGLKPYFNDFVVHKGHAFGFDGSILACIDLEDGKRKWKGGRYGSGQLILLPDQDALLVLSERGELALVEATPGEFREMAQFKAIEGKSWNHPVLAGDRLLVRNGEEMVAFRLSLAGP